MQQTVKKVTEIVVGVLKHQGKFLITQRQSHQDFAHNWEFPGGKIETGETPLQALAREFLEEVGVQTFGWQPLIEIPWSYEHKTLVLKVYQTESFTGEPWGAEGQNLRWVLLSDLVQMPFPAANVGILKALSLPDMCMITGDFSNQTDALQKLSVALQQGVRLVQLRARTLDETAFLAFAKEAVNLSHSYGAKCVLNGKPEWLDEVPQADGIQLASSVLMDQVTRPVPTNKWLGVSTHNDLDIAKALELGADFILISPVKATTSHPDLHALGWTEFSEKVSRIPVPVYALGGMKPQDVDQAIACGAQGVATTSGLWPQSF